MIMEMCPIRVATVSDYFSLRAAVRQGANVSDGANGLLDHIVNGWELSGVLLFQNGPFMSVATNQDPCGSVITRSMPTAAAPIPSPV